MSLPRRALLFVTPVLALAGVVFVLARSDPKPASQASPPAAEPTVAEIARAAPEPSLALEADAPPHPSEPPASAAAAVPTEESVAAEMHALEETSPERALDLARQGQALWPSGSRAAEFAATEVKCLYRLGMPSEGRGAAEAMVNKYLGSPWALEVERQTGAHPYVNH